MSTIAQQVGWLTCTKCGLHKMRKQVVLGRGNLKAKIMFVGEGPGPTEDVRGEPFIGPAGDMLNQFLKVFDLNRADVFIDNTVACWPHVDTDGKNVTRKPSAEEALACSERIQHSIYTVDPQVIVTLGAPALQALTGESTGITAVAGEVFETAVPGWYTSVPYPVHAMFHPAYLLRQTPLDPNEKKPNEKHPIRRTYRHFEDMLQTLGLLHEAWFGVDRT